MDVLANAAASAPVHDPVVGGQRDGRGASRHDFTVFHHGALLQFADARDAHLG